MVIEYNGTIYGETPESTYLEAYNKGRKEQLEQDVEMIRAVAFRSENFEDFKQLLRDEIKKVDTRTWF